jgi:hypothetical protein
MTRLAVLASLLGILDACSGAPAAVVSSDAAASQRSCGIVMTTASATSTYEGWPATNLIDGDERTSWFSAEGDSAAHGKPPSVTISFKKPVTVSHVRALGNRDPGYLHGYSILSAKLELLDGPGAVLSSREITSSGAWHDFDVVLPEPVTDVRAVRLTSLTDEGAQNEYGDIALAEIDVD